MKYALIVATVLCSGRLAIAVPEYEARKLQSPEVDATAACDFPQVWGVSDAGEVLFRTERLHISNTGDFDFEEGWSIGVVGAGSTSVVFPVQHRDYSPVLGINRAGELLIRNPVGDISATKAGVSTLVSMGGLNLDVSNWNGRHDLVGRTYDDATQTYTPYIVADGVATAIAPGTRGEWVNDERGWVLPSAVNNNGQVIGVVYDQQANPQPFMWKSGVLTMLPTGEGITEGMAQWITESGDIYGQLQVIDSNGTRDLPVMWRDGREILLPLPDGCVSGSLVGVNDAGELLMYAGEDETSSTREYLYVNGEFLDALSLSLTPEGEQFAWVMGPYQNGSLIGVTDGGDFFMVQPVPEGEAALVGLIAVALGWRRR